MKAPRWAGYHAFATLWVAGMLLFARQLPGRYAEAMQEDGLVEWTTAILFAVAGVAYLRVAFRQRRYFHGLVGLFCVFVAGEEISWGQRFFGFMPAAPFLAHNTQQEMTLHNFADFFGKPKWVLASVLVAYGLLLPVSQRLTVMRRAAARIGATVPSPELQPWFITCAGLLAWYPVEFTGEWVELLSATLFLAASGLEGLRLWLAGVVSVLAAWTLVIIPRRSDEDASRVSCARLEATALIHDLIPGRAANPSLAEFDEVEKRILSAADAGYLDFALLDSLGTAGCTGSPAADAGARREYAVDPWGTAYWLRTRRDSAGGVRVEVYSFGANRRRDEGGRGDDVVASGRYVP